MDWSIHDEWVQWMLNEHFPEMLKTGCFMNTKLLRLLETDENDGPTYAAQYFAATRSDYDRYIKELAPAIRKKYMEKWGDRVVTYRTLMQVIN